MLTMFPFKKPQMMQPEEITEAKLTDIKDKNDCNQKDEYVLEGQETNKKLHIKGILSAISQ